MRFLFSCIFYFLILSAGAQGQHFQKSWKDFSLNQKVKSFDSDKYYVEIRNDSVVKKTGYGEEVATFTFNENGFLTLQNQTGGGIGGRSSYQYDSSQTLLTNSDYYGEGAHGQIVWRYHYKYDTLNDLVCVIEERPSTYGLRQDSSKTDLSEFMTYSYNSKGQMIEELDCSNDSAVFMKVKCAYNKAGTQIESTMLNEPEDKSYQRVVDRFNKNGNLIQEDIYDSSGHYVRVVLKYDDEGNRTEEIYRYWKTKYEERWFWKYEYDSKRNWIKKSEFQQQGKSGIVKPVNVETRVIHYY
jgi:hypothetical protein